MLNVGNFREWSTITSNNHPSKPHSPIPISALRLAPVRLSICQKNDANPCSPWGSNWDVTNAARVPLKVQSGHISDGHNQVSTEGETMWTSSMEPPNSDWFVAVTVSLKPDRVFIYFFEPLHATSYTYFIIRCSFLMASLYIGLPCSWIMTMMIRNIWRVVETPTVSNSSKVSCVVEMHSLIVLENECLP